MLTSNVKKFRVEAGMSQRDLSYVAGVTRQTMSLIEKGEYNPTISLCLRICCGLHKTLDKVFWLKQGGLRMKKIMDERLKIQLIKILK